MKDAEELIERILYLDGVPNLQRLGTVRVGETVRRAVRPSTSRSSAAIERYNRGIALAVDKGDNGTRELLEDRLEGEEEHADWLETQLALIDQVGSRTTWPSRSATDRRPPRAENAGSGVQDVGEGLGVRRP